MTPEAGTPRDVVEKDFLSSAYDFVTCICQRDGVDKERTLELLKEDRNRSLKKMKDLKLPEKKIKKALKDAANEHRETLFELGLTPELLY